MDTSSIDGIFSKFVNPAPSDAEKSDLHTAKSCRSSDIRGLSLDKSVSVIEDDCDGDAGSSLLLFRDGGLEGD